MFSSDPTKVLVTFQLTREQAENYWKLLAGDPRFADLTAAVARGTEIFDLHTQAASAREVWIDLQQRLDQLIFNS